MDVLKTIIIIVIITVGSSVGVTYLYLNHTTQIEMNHLTNIYENQIDNLESAIIYYDNYTNSLEIQLDDVQLEFYLINQSLQENLSEVEKLQTGDKYDLHDPTYIEIRDFIRTDKTDEIPYENDTFDCEHFAQLLNNNSKDHGIRCAYVVLYFYGTNGGHAIIGFNTVDRGMVYVEPQSDEWVENLVIGNDYWTDCVVPLGNYEYKEAPNDTIKEILIFW